MELTRKQWREMSEEERTWHRSVKHQRWRSEKPTWETIFDHPPVKLNLGGKSDKHPRRWYEGWTSIDIREVGGRSIKHDLTEPIPLPDESVDALLSEHFLEHLEIEHVVPFLRECRRILKQGCLFRLATPDYDHPKHKWDVQSGRDRHNINHRTLTNRELVERCLIDAGWKLPEIDFRQYWDKTTVELVNKGVDYTRCWVRRTPENDPRNTFDCPYRVVSVVVDLEKEVVVPKKKKPGYWYRAPEE